MSSQRRIASSRANGAKSHGPVTPQGKRISAANSLRHGALAGLVLLSEEKQSVFTGLLADLTREFNPQTEAQRVLVEGLAIARWRTLRIWAVEGATLEAAIQQQPPSDLPSADRVALAFKTLADNSRVLDLLARYESRYERQFARSLNLLLKLADPDCPIPQICQTNPVPQSDSASDTPPTNPENSVTSDENISSGHS